MIRSRVLAALLLSLAVVPAGPSVFGCGGCPLASTEVVSVTPAVECLKVSGTGNDETQCVTPSMKITNDCADTLTFAEGDTANDGRLEFPPGTTGYYNAVDGSEGGELEITGKLGAQQIVIRLRGVPL